MARRLICASIVTAFLAASAGGTMADDRPPWCDNKGAKNPAETTICATQSLWQLDDVLNLSYAFAYDRLSPAQKRIMAASQASWLAKTRNGCGTDVACLARVMQIRSDALDDINNRGEI